MVASSLVVVIVLAVIGAVCELFAASFGEASKWVAGIAMMTTAFASGALLMMAPTLFSGLLFFVTIYRVLNCLKVIEGRLESERLRHAVRRTGLLLIATQLVIIALWLLQKQLVHMSGRRALYGLAAAQLITAALLFLSTLRSLKKTIISTSGKALSDSELPTVSVCVPARDETEDLAECLTSILASDYPKLEVLALDDNSHDRTPEIIKQFAHEGVRFITGDEPHDGWLAKNQAYDKLMSEATGEILLFCGVDVRMSPKSMRVLITTLVNKDKAMLSVLPKRHRGGLATAIIQPLRYWWELCLPRRQFNRPPVLSTLWLIRSKTLKKLGGFKAVSGKIVPEAYFARELTRQDGYSFMRFEGVETVKGYQEQHDTAIRMQYPQVRRRPELVALLTAASLGLLVGPFALIIAELVLDGGLIVSVAAVFAALLLLLTQVSVLSVTDPRHLFFGTLILPLSLIWDTALRNASMYKYEFSEVTWKGRPVSRLELQAIPKLPKI